MVEENFSFVHCIPAGLFIHLFRSLWTSSPLQVFLVQKVFCFVFSLLIAIYKTCITLQLLMMKISLFSIAAHYEEDLYWSSFSEGTHDV